MHSCEIHIIIVPVFQYLAHCAYINGDVMGTIENEQTKETVVECSGQVVSSPTGLLVQGSVRSCSCYGHCKQQRPAHALHCKCIQYMVYACTGGPWPDLLAGRCDFTIVGTGD
jgi:hypothetical protein